jgi:hypothetical protein
MSILKRFRSSRTGQYVTKAEAQANEDTTVSETVKQQSYSPTVMRAVQHCIERNGLEGTLERLRD